MSSLKYSVIDFMKTNRITKPVYRQLKKRLNPFAFKIEDLQTILPNPSDGEEIRYNLVLPTLRNTKVFGGILTTIKILELLMKQYGYHARIIVLHNEKYSSKWTYSVEGFSYDETAENQLFYIGNGKSIGVKKNDVFIFTSWKTAYTFMPVLQWQIEQYHLRNRKALYLIQDYEPGFFAWSAEYMLAESTYKTDADKIIALYNSKELYEYFQKKQYDFSAEEYFEPALNESLKKQLMAGKEIKREKQILIYGRPNEHRNAFEIIKGALALWSEDYSEASEWRIISLGEYFEDVKLANNVVKVRGKVSLEEYADIMLASYAGISLMVSPHPSYPPLEMSSFGIRTITNAFENKELSYFNENIVSVDNCTPGEIAKKLTLICRGYEEEKNNISLDSPYVKGGQFETVIEKIGVQLHEMVHKD